MALTKFNRYRLGLIYGIALACLLLLLKRLEWHLLIVRQAFDVYAGAIALLFTGLGILLAPKLWSPKAQTIVIEKPVLTVGEFVFNEKELSRLRISSRELEVLELMAGGLTNPQIADKLFVSLNTIKTHSSSLFLKLEVSRRVQAIARARQLGLIA